MEPLPQIRIGTAGWSYKDWDGVFYPHGMQRRKEHPLEYLARCFDVVEINTSFYGHVKPELAKLWKPRYHQLVHAEKCRILHYRPAADRTCARAHRACDLAGRLRASPRTQLRPVVRSREAR